MSGIADESIIYAKMREEKNYKLQCDSRDNIRLLVNKRLKECLEDRYTPEQEVEYLKVFKEFV